MSHSIGEGVRRESPTDVSVRSRLYGYGAASWCATPLGLVGIESRTQQLCRLGADLLEPVEATAPGVNERLGDPTSVPGSNWVVFVSEQAWAMSPRVALVAIDVQSGERVELQVIDGLAAELAVDAQASHLAWIQWPAGTMPWDGAALHVAHLELDGARPALHAGQRLDGGRACSAGQPTWLGDGSLAFVTEAAGTWQPWHRDLDGAVHRLNATRGEFQRPRWTTCRWLAAHGTGGSLLCAYADADGEHVAIMDPAGRLEVIDQPCTRIDGVAADAASIAWVGATAHAQGAVLLAPGASRSQIETVPAWDNPNRPSIARHLDAEDLEPVTFTLTYDDVELTGVHWAPTRLDEHGSPSPLVVMVHPGPTGSSDRSYSPFVHLMCANGIGVASIDYSGSTAHGRAHRERLIGRYCELDVAECTAAASWLIDSGTADSRATFIRGTSAGGTTALLALCAGVFAGAVAWYPASRFDTEHDEPGFEAGYLSALLGAGGSTRSPLARAAAMIGSVLIVQGENDEVIDPVDTAVLVARLHECLDDVTSVLVPGEGHGFRTAAGRSLALASELDFYRRLTVIGRRAALRYDSSTSGTNDLPGAS